ncbi:hypothetical protein [Clostridium massiliamazoniense]|uniref:hypothetical protein n=1 Tax=Clostridium massiliamazoniense TaxID=1347366 RepID=UPI0006D85818|nr:hypothetical protein [Clostridium massiliamazoniense]
MEKKNKYFIVNSVRLAKALSFLGFDYYVYTDNGKEIFSFIDSKELRQARANLLNLRKIYHVDYK